MQFPFFNARDPEFQLMVRMAAIWKLENAEGKDVDTFRDWIETNHAELGRRVRRDPTIYNDALTWHKAMVRERSINSNQNK